MRKDYKKQIMLFSRYFAVVVMLQTFIGLQAQQLHSKANIHLKRTSNSTTMANHKAIAGEKTVSGIAEVTILVGEYLFPYDISTDGEYVVISGFGDESTNYWWSEQQGIATLTGSSTYGISDDGLIAGSFRNPDYVVTGLEVFMAGTWDRATMEWEFLGINPEIPNVVNPDYNSGWGIDASGQTVVGMQYDENYGYEAFKWTSDGGYEMIGDPESSGSRPNGISRSGDVIYGWANINNTGRSPAIWANGEFIYINPFAWGEASAASYDGTYVTGSTDNLAFIWENGGEVITFSNTLGIGNLMPTLILEDKTVMGYYSDFWPPNPDTRQTFVRHPDGTLESFNDYAEARGMTDAQDWTFLSINDATPDGTKFIGAGINPQGQYVSFLLKFLPDAALVAVNPTSLNFTIEEGMQANGSLNLANTGTSNLSYSTSINYTGQGGWLTANPVAGTIVPGQSFNMIIGYNASNLEVGTYTASLIIQSNAFNTPQLTVPVSLTVTEACVAPANLMAEIDNADPNLVMLNWEHPAVNSREFVGFKIYKNNNLIAENVSTNSYSYSEMQIENHCYEVSAVYDNCGETNRSNEACVDITVNTAEVELANLLIYPNPAKDYLKITANEAIKNLEIYNSIGKLVINKSGNDNQTMEVSLSDITSGLYFIRIELAGEKFLSKKLLVD